MRANSVLAGLLMAVAFAAPAVAAPRVLTLDEAVALAQRNAVAVVRAQGTSRTSTAAVRAAKAAFLPSLSLSAGASRQLPAGGSTRVENGQVITVASDPWSSSVGLGASVDLFDGGARIFQLQQANANRASAAADEVAQRFEAALAAKQAYFDVLAARETQVATAAQQAQAGQQRVTAVAKARAKTATRSDSLRAEIQVRAADLAAMQAATSLATSEASLARVVGSLEPVTAADDSLLAAAAIALPDSALAALADEGPTVRGALSDLDAAKAARRTAWAAWLPTVGASWSRSASGTANTPDWSDLDASGSVRLSLSLPLFDQLQRTQRNTQSAVAVTNAEAALRDARLAARQSLVNALGSWRAADQSVASQRATVEAAEEDLRVQQQRYVANSSTLLDVLTSQAQLDQARHDLIRARYDQRVAKAQLEALTGRDL